MVHPFSKTLYSKRAWKIVYFENKDHGKIPVTSQVMQSFSFLFTIIGQLQHTHILLPASYGDLCVTSLPIWRQRQNTILVVCLHFLNRFISPAHAFQVIICYFLVCYSGTQAFLKVTQFALVKIVSFSSDQKLTTKLTRHVFSCIPPTETEGHVTGFWW